MRNVEEAKVCWRDCLGPWVGEGGGLGVHDTGPMGLELNLALPSILQMRKLRRRKGKGLAHDQRESQSHKT